MSGFALYFKPMQTRRGVAALVLCLLGCKSAEPATSPLGFGPLGKAELADETPHASSMRSTVHRGGRPTPSVSTAPTASGEPVVAVPEPPASAASAGVAAAASAQGHGGDAWAGLWQGHDVTQFDVPPFPAEPMKDDRARIRVETLDERSLQLVLIDSSNESDLCTLSAKLVENEARVSPGQSCFGSDNDAFELVARVRTGVARLERAMLTFEMVLDAELQAEQGDTNGNIHYRFEGERQ